MSKLQVINQNGHRVLTTSQLAEAYGTDGKRISNNYGENKERYTEGKHFFKLEGDELRRFKSESLISGIAPNVNVLYLWTEKGAWLHAKSLNTDQAWEAYEALVDDYYRVIENQLAPPIQDLSPQLQLLINMELKQKELEQAISDTKGEVQGIREIVALNPNDWREDSKNLIVKIAQSLGGNEYIREVRAESYELLNSRMGVNLKARLTNKRQRMADEGVCKSKRDKLTYLDVIAEDKKLIEGYVAVVKDMAIKYGNQP